jgi:hypothetical protein
MSFSLRPLRRRCCPQIHKRTALQLIAFSLASSLAFSPHARAASSAKNDASTPEQYFADLEQRASQAKPREQAYLYTELVHEMTEEAGKQISDGDTEQAAVTLKQVNRYAHLIHVNLARDTKQLKNAEMLMHNTTYRLAQFLHLVSGDDKKNVQDTLAQLDQVNDEMLNQVFDH